MTSARRQKGVVLLFVVILLALMGMGLIIWSAQSQNMVKDTRMQLTQAQLDNALSSTAQWAAANRSKLEKEPVSPDLTALQTAGINCQCRIIDHCFSRTTVEITVVSNTPGRSARKTIQVNL